jgi:hypothetical protein
MPRALLITTAAGHRSYRSRIAQELHYNDTLCALEDLGLLLCKQQCSLVASLNTHLREQQQLPQNYLGRLCNTSVPTTLLDCPAGGCEASRVTR